MDGTSREEQASRIIDFTTRLHDALCGLNASEAEKQLRKFGDELGDRIERAFQIDTACVAGLDQALSAHVTDDVRTSILGSLKLPANTQNDRGDHNLQADKRLQAIARINAAWGGDVFRDYQFADLGRPTALLLARVARAYPHWRYAVQRINVAMLSRHIEAIRHGTGLMIGHHHSTSSVKEPHKPIESLDLKLVLAWKERGEIELDGVCLPDVGSDIPHQLKSVVNEWSISEDVPLHHGDCARRFSPFHLVVKDLHQLLVPRPQVQVHREGDQSSRPTNSTATAIDSNDLRATNDTHDSQPLSQPRSIPNNIATPTNPCPPAPSSPEDLEEPQGSEHAIPSPHRPPSPWKTPRNSRKRPRTSGKKATLAPPRNRRSSRFADSSDDSDGEPDTPISQSSSTSSNRDTPTPIERGASPGNGGDFCGLHNGNPDHSIDENGRRTISGKMPKLRLAGQKGKSHLFVHSSDDSDDGLDTPADRSESPSDLDRRSPKLPTPRTSPSVDPFSASMQLLLGGDVGQCADFSESQALQSPEGTNEALDAEPMADGSFFDDAFGATVHDAFNDDIQDSSQRNPDFTFLSQACRVMDDIFTVGGFRPTSGTRPAKILYHPHGSASCEPDEAEIQCLTYSVLETWAGLKTEVTLPTIVQDPERDLTAGSSGVLKADGRLTDVTHTRTVLHGNSWLKNSHGIHLCVVAPMSMLGVHPGSAVFLEQGDILIVPYGTYCNVVTFDSGVLHEGIVSSCPSERPFTADRLLSGLGNIKSFPEFLILAD